MQEKRLGSIYGFTGGNFAGLVYDKEFLSPALKTAQGGNRQPMIIDDLHNNREAVKPVCLNSKGGRGGIDGLQPSLQDKVYSTKAISPAVTTSFMPNFLEEERNAKDCGYNNKELEGICTKGKAIDIASTILAGYERTNMTGFNADNGVLETYYLSEKGKKYVCDPKRGMCTDINADICQTLTAKGQNNWTGSFVSEDIDRLEKDTTIGSNEPTKIHLKSGVQITSNDDLKAYRIRKLTPRECWRLMGFSDEDFYKAEAVNSNTQLYKQAGNSIVKDVLMAIFKQMLPYEERQIEGVGKQLMVDMAVKEDKEKMPF